MFYQMTFSPTGGTKKAAEFLGTAWQEEKTWIDLSNKDTDFSTYTFEKEDICIVSVPSFGGRVPAVATERLKQMRGGGASAILLAVYGNRAFEDTLIELQDTLTEQGFCCRGAVGAVAEHSIMRQFGAGRPDEKDGAELKGFSEKIKAQIEAGKELSAVAGNRPYKAYATIPMVPKAGKKCGGCGVCAEKCPVGAIPKETPNETDEKKCISCMRCVAVCPSQARAVNKLVLAGATMKLKKALEGRKENELFL